MNPFKLVGGLIKCVVSVVAIVSTMMILFAAVGIILLLVAIF